MAGFILAGFVLLLSYWLTGRLCSPTSRISLLDWPTQRSLHIAPTPRTGGLAILGSFGAGLLGSLVVEWFGASPGGIHEPAHTVTTLWILGLVLVIGTISLLDDRIGLSPGIRFGVQAVAAVGIVWGAGLRVNEITVPFLCTLSLGWLGAPLTILFLMWMTNLYNFMDGMDGFAGGMTVLGFGFLSYLAWAGGHSSVALLSLLIAGAAGGFLFFNMPPARIFMGDVGSVPLGFLAGVITVMEVHDGLFDIWVPVLIFSPFIVDATVTLFQRMLRREKVWQPHREHYYQRLVLAGWGQRKAVLAEYGLMLACGVSALLYVKANEPWRLVLLLGWVVIYCSLAFTVRALEVRYAAQHRVGL